MIKLVLPFLYLGEVESYGDATLVHDLHRRLGTYGNDIIVVYAGTTLYNNVTTMHISYWMISNSRYIGGFEPHSTIMSQQCT